MNLETRIFSCFVTFILGAALALLWRIRDDLRALRESPAQAELVKPAVEFRPHREKEVEITAL